MVTVVYKTALEIWWPKDITMLAQFRTTLQLVRIYLHIGKRYHQSENRIAIYEHSCTRRWMLVHKRWKIRP